MRKLAVALLIMLFGVESFSQNIVFEPYTIKSNVKSEDYFPDKIVFKLKSGITLGSPSSRISETSFQTVLTQIGGTDVKPLFDLSKMPAAQFRKSNAAPSDLNLIYELTISKDKSLLKSINQLLKSGLVQYAEPKFISRPLFVPNDDFSDSLTGAQYHLNLIRAYEAWNDSANRGDTNMVLGIIDTGFLNTFVDFKDNIKYNHGEMGAGKENNDIDDDADGYVDNWQGWDVSDNDNDPTFENNHGLCVAGLSSATPNNDTMVIGTGFHCKFLPIKASKTGTNGSIDKGYEGITYAITHGCKVVNLSWGHVGYSQSEQDFINDVVVNYDVMIVAAAGNINGSTDYYYPASFDNVMSVTYSASDDVKYGGNYNDKIDIDAPGVNVKTIDQNGLRNTTGSSVAAPQVSGVAIALRAKFPLLSGLQIAEILRMSADIIDTIPANATYKGKMGRGRLNMLEAFKGMQSPAVRQTGINFVNQSNSSIVVSGDTALLRCQFKNYLLPTSANAKISIEIDNPYIELIDSVFSVGTIGTMVTTNNSGFPFRFKIKPDAPFKLVFKVQLLYVDGAYTDQEVLELKVNIPNVELNVNQASLTISAKGRNGFMDWDNNSKPIEGKGWNCFDYLFNYESGLMVATSATKVSDAVRGEGIVNDHFNPINYPKETTNATYGQIISSKFDDTKNLDPNARVGVSIVQKSFAWDSTGIDRSLIIEYKITNTTANTFDSLCVGIFNDIDVPSDGYANNAVSWNDSHHVGYATYSLSNFYYAGMKLLSPQKENFYAIDNFDAGGNNINISDGFTPAEKFTALSSGVARTQAGTKVGGNDVSMVIGATLYNLAPGETTTVAFAYIMAASKAEMLANADAIQAKYMSIRKGHKPTIANSTICKNATATLTPASATNYSYYKSNTIIDANKLASGSSYTTNQLSADTAFYVVSTDSIFKSDFTKANVYLANLNPDFTALLDNGVPGKVTFTGNNAMTSWDWSFGDLSTGNGKVVNNIYGASDTYDVKLIVTNGIGCKDSITKQVVVDNFVTASGSLNLQKGEYFNAYPNPSNGSYNLELALNTTEAIAVKIFDAIGNMVFASKEVPKAIDLSAVPTGIYILQVQTGSRILTQKLYLGTK